MQYHDLTSYKLKMKHKNVNMNVELSEQSTQLGNHMDQQMDHLKATIGSQLQEFTVFMQRGADTNGKGMKYKN